MATFQGHYIEIDEVTDPIWYLYADDTGNKYYEEYMAYSDQIIIVAIDKEWYK